MFENISREQLLRQIGMVFTLVMLFGVDLTKYGLTPDSVAQAMTTLILIVSLVVNAVGYIIRYFKGDVKPLGGRRYGP